MAMKFEEFAVRLQELKAEFRSLNGRDPETMAEFESFLVRKKFGRLRSADGAWCPPLRSLRGFDI